MNSNVQTLFLDSCGLDVYKLESFVESVCDEMNIYNEYFSNIITSVVNLYESVCSHSAFKGSLKIDFYNDSNGLNFLFYINNESLMRELQVVLEDRASILDDDNYDWIFILDRLCDRIELLEEGILLQYDIKSINAELANVRVMFLKSYLVGDKVFNN